MTENQLSTDDEGAEGDPRPNMVASLDVRSFDGSPEVITGILGLQPSRSGQAGYPSYDVLGKPRGHIVRNSFWSLRSGAGFHASIEEHANDLLHQIHASRDAFPLLPVGSVVVFDCTIIPGEYLPSFTLGARVLRELGAIGAAFKLDIIRIIHTPNDVTPET